MTAFVIAAFVAMVLLRFMALAGRRAIRYIYRPETGELYRLVSVNEATGTWRIAKVNMPS